MGGENLGRTTIRYVTLAKKMEMAHNGMETVHFGPKYCTWHPHMELCPSGWKRTMLG